MAERLRPDETWHRLRGWTYGQAQSEGLAAHVLLAEGYTDLDPSHPRGGRDGGADALARRDGKRWVMAVYFPREQQSIAEITKKFKGDLAGVAKNDADGMVFVTNQELARGDRAALIGSAGVPIEIYHLERVTLLLDQPKLHAIREQLLYIPASTAGGLDAPARLAELMRASIAGCVERWLAVGLDRAEAVRLADDAQLGAPPPYLLPDRDQPVIVWTGPMRCGKSIAAERAHQAALRAFETDEPSPIPMFLKAHEALPSLAEAVADACAEIGDPRRVGARVIVDGLDETGQQATGDLLAQARVLAGTWPETTIVLTSRPDPALGEASEHRELPALPQQAQERCIAIGAGGDIGFGRLEAFPAAVRATLRYPLFALLAGIWMRQRQGDPRDPLDLLQMLGERATRGLSVDQRQLRALAVKSVARELAPVPAAEIDAVELRSLIGTGLVVERPGGLAFGLPALAQWFAADALRLGETAVEDLLDAPEDLELWREPLALAIASAPSTQGATMVREMLAAEPGFACRVLDAGLGQAVVTGLRPPPWREGARQARAALQAIADSLGPLAPLVAHTGPTGQVLPMAAGSGAYHLTIGFFGDANRPEIAPLPPRGQGGLTGVRSSQVGEGAAWAWRWALRRVRDNVDHVLQHRALPVPSVGPLADEEAWAAAIDLLNQSPLLCATLPIPDVLEAVERLTGDSEPGGAVIVRVPGRRPHELSALRRYLLDKQAGGHAELSAPLPVADKQAGGWVGDFYSDERLLDLATTLYRCVLVAYKDLVERWMPTLAPRLEHYVLMPARVVGFLGNDPGGLGRIPQMDGYLEALPDGSTDEVAIDFADFDLSVAEPVYAQQRAARPLAARWITGTVGSMSLEVAERYPVSDAVYAWLTHDLQQLTLASIGQKDASRGALTIWETRRTPEASTKS